MVARGNILSHVDWPTVFMFLGLALFGWLNIYGASYNYDQSGIFDFSNRAGKQFVWIITALVMGGAILLIDYKTFDVLAYIFYAIMLAILLVTPVLAHDIKGSLSWITIGPVSLQPAEFAKCITALAIAKYMGRYEYKLRDWHDLIIPFALIGVPTLVIMILQRETGSALVFASFLLVFYRQGMSGYVLWSCVVAVALFIFIIRFGGSPLPLGVGSWGMLICSLMLVAIALFVIQKEERKIPYLYIPVSVVAGLYLICTFFAIWFPVNFDYLGMSVIIMMTLYVVGISVYWRRWRMLLLAAFLVGCLAFTQGCNLVFTKVLQDHQRTRIEVLLGMKDDPQGVGYNVRQAKIAIGSGRFFGKGFLQGTQTKLKFVPEQDTDFIFCTVGEEWGFVGSVGVLIVYLLFILRLIKIAERQRETFSQIYAYAVASIFFFHLTINVGMVLGLLPVIGIPLPFFSYGGSSLWGFTILLFILLRLDAARLERLN